jgi:hypothetical protein
MKAFVSSTYSDLIEHRQAVIEMLLRLKLQPIAMEFFGAEPNEPKRVCADEIRECDLFIGIYAHRYGHVPESDEKSITEQEFDIAQGLGKPCFCYIVDEDYPWLPKMIEEEPGRSRLVAFKSRLDKALVRDTFTTPDELAARAASRLGRWRAAIEGEPPPVTKGERITVTESAWRQFLSACRLQVKREVKSVAGKKYLPGLYVRREAESDFVNFIDTAIEHDLCARAFNSLERLGKAEKVSSLVRTVKDIRTLVLLRRNEDKVQAGFQRISEDIETIGDKIEKRRTKADKERFKDRTQALVRDTLENASRIFKSCYLVIDRAGSGKTNLLCDLALGYATKYPTVFVSGRLIIENEASIERYIEDALTRVGDLSLRLSLTQLYELLDARESFLLVFIDGINENSDTAGMKRALQTTLSRVSDRRVKFCISCRDVFWSFFDDLFWDQYVYRRLDGKLYTFTDMEFDQARSNYLTHFQIKGSLVHRAEKSCRHPLLLRFFCESYRGEDVGTVQEIRLKELFDRYWEKKIESIRRDLELRTSADIERLLLGIVRRMWKVRKIALDMEEVRDISPGVDLSRKDSIYTRVLDEDIIIEEELDEITGEKRVMFVYDEFTEYCMAREMFRSLSWSSETRPVIVEYIRILMEEAVDYITLVGVIEYLTIMVNDARGMVLWDIFVDRELEWQRLVLRAIRQMRQKAITEEVVQVLYGLTKTGYPDITEEVARLAGELSELHPEESLRLLTALVSNKRWAAVETRKAAIWSLRRLSRLMPERVAQVLTSVAEDWSSDVQWKILDVVESADWLPHDTAVSILLSLVRNSTPESSGVMRGRSATIVVGFCDAIDWEQETQVLTTDRAESNWADLLRLLGGTLSRHESARLWRILETMSRSRNPRVHRVRVTTAAALLVPTEKVLRMYSAIVRRSTDSATLYAVAESLGRIEMPIQEPDRERTETLKKSAKRILRELSDARHRDVRVAAETSIQVVESW